MGPSSSSPLAKFCGRLLLGWALGCCASLEKTKLGAAVSSSSRVRGTSSSEGRSRRGAFFDWRLKAFLNSLRGPFKIFSRVPRSVEWLSEAEGFLIKDFWGESEGFRLWTAWNNKRCRADSEFEFAADGSAAGGDEAAAATTDNGEGGLETSGGVCAVEATWGRATAAIKSKDFIARA